MRMMKIYLTRSEWRRIEQTALFRWLDRRCARDEILEFWWRVYVELMIAWMEDPAPGGHD